MRSVLEDATHTTTAVLAAIAASDPEADFVIADDRSVTYGEMGEWCASIGAALVSAGLSPGDRVGVLLPNGSRWFAAVLGAHAAGLAAVPLNTWSRPSELKATVERSGIRLLFADPEMFGEDFRAVIRSAQLTMGDGVAVETWYWPRHLLFPEVWPPAEPDQPVGSTPSSPGRRGPSLLHEPLAEEEGEAFVLFTSGSTSAPKAVPLRHSALLRNGFAVGERQGIVAGDRFWLASPLFFVFGCGNAFPNALTHGATLCVQERFRPGEALEFIQQHRCTVFYGVAPIVRALASDVRLAEYDISSLRTGTANMTAADLTLAISVLGVEEVCNAYGMTEGYGHSTITDHKDPPEARIRTQGRPLPTQEVRVVTAEGSIASPDETGSIQIRGAISTGYLDAEELNAAAYDADGWFRTGDVGFFDGDGRLHYVGRSSEMMKVNSINVSPAEIEVMLVEHPGVDQAFVFSVDDSGEGDVVGCTLVSEVAAHARQALVTDVASWARGRMSTYKVPRFFEVRRADELPLTASGKVSKRELQGGAILRVARSE